MPLCFHMFEIGHARLHSGSPNLIRIRHKFYEIGGLGALLSAVMRRLCVVRSEGVPRACAQNRVTCKKANAYHVFIPAFV